MPIREPAGATSPGRSAARRRTRRSGTSGRSCSPAATGTSASWRTGRRARRRRPQRLGDRDRRLALRIDARCFAPDHDRADAPNRERRARADGGTACGSERTPGRRDRAAGERKALPQHPRQRPDRRRLHRSRRPRDPGQSALLRAHRLRGARADHPQPGGAHPPGRSGQRRDAHRPARRRRDPDVPPAQALPAPRRRGDLGALDRLAAARRRQPAVAHRRRGRGHHRAPSARGSRARTRGRRSLEPGQERFPLAHEPRAAHAAERHARLRPAARDRSPQPADADAAAVGGADPAGRLAPAGDDQRRARPVAHRVRQPAPARPRRSSSRARAGHLALVASDAAKRGIRISAELAPGSTAVFGDATRVKQILTNLLSNAVKYNIDDGRIHVASRLAGPDVVEIVGHRHRHGHDAGADGRAVPALQPARPRAHGARRAPASAW